MDNFDSIRSKEGCERNSREVVDEISASSFKLKVNAFITYLDAVEYPQFGLE
jgi:hypothetical protein